LKPASPAGGLPGTFDPVEDGLVEQQEMERDMDSTFVDRRLLHEAEAVAEDPLASLASASGPSSAVDPPREVELVAEATAALVPDTATAEVVEGDAS